MRINEYTKNKNRKPIRKFVNSKQIRYSLMAGVDRDKDQSYFLWTLTQKQLKHCLFPIGDYTKPEVRKLAKKFGLPNWNKKDSQGVCFVGPLDMKEFLKSYIKPKTGEIRSYTSQHDRIKMNTKQNNRSAPIGKFVGYHDGVYYYTIGQRHGLNISDGSGPYYVAGKDVKKNILYITRDPNALFIYPAYASYINKLAGQEILVKNVNWINGNTKLPIEVSIKIRYRSEAIPAILTCCKGAPCQGAPLARGALATVLVKFKKPARAVTPGQSAVFYKGEEVLGGGVIL